MDFGKAKDFVSAQEIIKALDDLDNDSQEAIMKVLNLAEHVESTSKTFYEDEEKRTKGTELEAFFAFLVKEETMHLEKILAMKKNVKNGKIKEIGFERNVAPHIHAIPAGNHEMTAILYALWREKKAQEFYADAGKKTKGTIKKFFSELAEFEQGHVRLLEEYLDDMQNAGELIMG
jgi:rubrerythrin